MRLLSSTAVLLVCSVGLALAGPAKKLEKKSIGPKALEPVDRKLEAPKLGDEALMEVAGENVDRAKKQASTTFCVEIRQNKPTQVDCDELNNRPIPAPMPAEPQEPSPPAPPPPPPPSAPSSQSPSGPSQTLHIVPHQVPGDVKFELPCEPEMAAFFVQPPGEVVYAPTGNCAPHVPALLHVPSGGSGGAPLFGSGAPSVNVLHLPSGSGSSGAQPAVHVTPLHTTTLGGGGASAHSPSLLHVIQPSPLHQHGLHQHNLLPLHHGSGASPLHGLHHLSGVECTCKSTGTLGKSADGSPAPPSNEALAMRFLQDLQRNANAQAASAAPQVVQVAAPAGQAPAAMAPQSHVVMLAPSDSPNVAMPTGKTEMRYMPMVRPMSNMQQQQVVYQQQTAMNGMGMHGGYPIHAGYGMAPLYSAGGVLRSKADCLEDSFGRSGQMLPQGLRLSREEAEDSQRKPEEPQEPAKPSPSDLLEAMRKQSEKPAKDEENSRVARFLVDKSLDTNALDEKQ